MTAKEGKTQDFFKFAKEAYNPQTEKFTIENLSKERERFYGYVNEATKDIEDEGNPDLKATKTIRFNKTIRHAQREIAMAKTALAKNHIKDLQDELSAIGKEAKEIAEEVNASVVESLEEQGRTDLAKTFITAPKITVRTSPIADPDKVQAVLDFLASLGISADVYVNDKKASERTEWGRGREKDTIPHKGDGDEQEAEM